MAKLINGNGNPAIYAWEDADLIASLAGNVTCIANVGNKYAATEEDANTIGLADGVIITKEGRRIQLDAGETDLFAIPTGSSGVTNYYIIGYKLVQNADSTQVAETFVQKMSSSSETITEDTFRGGATEVYVSLYRVTQVGFDITAVDGLLPAFLDNAAIKDDIAQINSDLGSKSSASGISGNDAFSKIATLNSDLSNKANTSDFIVDSQTFTPDSATHGDLYGNIRFKRSGHVVTVELHGFTRLANQYVNTVLPVGDILAKYRPNDNVIFMTTGGTLFYKIMVKSDGELTVYPYNGVTDQNNVAGTFSYIVS